MKRDELNLDDVGRLVREAQILNEERRTIDWELHQSPVTTWYLDENQRIGIPIPADIRELLIKLHKDGIQVRIKEIEDLVLPQKR